MTVSADVHTDLIQRLRANSQPFYEKLDPVPSYLLEWADSTGLSKGKTELRRVLSLQAALAHLLVALLNDLRHHDEQAYLDAAPALNMLPYAELLSSSGKGWDTEELQLVANELRAALPKDVLGWLYEKLTPQAERRTLGQYWTPSPIAELLTVWATGAGPRVLDPAVGSGRFIHALERKQAGVVCNEKPYIRAFEISPLVLLVAKVNAALADSKDVRLDVRLGDFLSAAVDPEAFDAVVCNPPYTRHHHLSDEMKDTLSKRTVREFGIRPSGFTSLFVYFFIRAISSVRQGGRLAFITPSELYEASYSVPFKQILKENAAPAAIISFDKSHQVFDGVDTAGCITLATRGSDAHQVTALLEIAAWPGTAPILEAIESGQDQELEWGSLTFVETESLDPSAKWSNFRQMTTPASTLPPLSSLAKVIRGVATGANDYFCLSHQETREHDIPEQYLTPVIRKTRLVKNFRFDLQDIERLGNEGHKVWLFNCQQSREDTPPNVLSYIEKGEQLGLPERALLKQKKAKWYKAERRDPPPILFTYLGRGNTRFIYNAAGAQALNVFLLVYPDKTIAQDPARVEAFTAILNSSPIKQQLHIVGRTYGGNTVKLEPREMDRLPVLDPRLLDSDEVERVNHRFFMLCQSPNDPHRRTTLDDEVAALITKYEGHVHEGPQETLF